MTNSEEPTASVAGCHDSGGEMPVEGMASPPLHVAGRAAMDAWPYDPPEENFTLAEWVAIIIVAGIVVAVGAVRAAYRFVVGFGGAR